MKKIIVACAAGVLLFAGCEQGSEEAEPASTPFESRYEPLPSGTTLITGATVLTGAGERLDDADILIENGRITAVGSDLGADGADVVDAAGKWVTPGIIDVHSHRGVYSSPGTESHSDGNEATSPVTADVWAEHAVWPHDPGFPAALAGGVTSMQILPGSANLIGGRGVTLKNVPGRNVMEMKFPGAPHGLKMACGENPKRVYGGRGQAPGTRMGNVAGYREAWIKAAEYRDKIEAAEDGQGEMPTRDLELETLMGVLEGEILVHNHCYRGDEMSIMLDVAREFGYKVGTFHHAVEAYKISDLLAQNDTCAAMWADWWGFKMEAYDGIRENIAFVDEAGACAIVHSDSGIGIQRLNQEAAKVIGAAARIGIDIAPERAIRWLTANAAKSLGILEQTGTLEAGKMADVVIWNRDPFSVYARAERVYIDGALAYELGNAAVNPVTDFTLGTAASAGGAQ
ncbi:MAG: amidohydrolase [Gammaproteobacteria bacterium]|nr:amidohydrolase [Gammaproteobacteria bacterium]NNF49737.1 amidohydrolase [Woeseiaceae bacterium]MBT8094141.1 amidohydrolase [Gammaproteobacteria bacterium]MBT8106544.1 amidohydrolase [Gammaproteobacteria bacterium]NNK26559.1 amidohydrolase [Woeseiaceae bacterium]